MTIREIETLLNAVSHYGNNTQITKAVEELAELQKPLCKLLVLAGNNASAEAVGELRYSIDEEMADVEIMLEQLKIIFGNHVSVDRWRQAKLARLATRIAEEREGAK